MFEALEQKIEDQEMKFNHPHKLMIKQFLKGQI